ncbi:MAG: hypothetical protein ACRC7O_06720, partial [Fimbriiglobus sp.]
MSAAVGTGTEPDDATLWRAGPVRDTVFLGMVALVVVFVGMTVRGGPLPGLIAPAVGALGLAFRLPTMPVAFVGTLAYLLVFP